MSFGQIVVGPPGSGKTSYCNAMLLFLTELGRTVKIVNLDPANEYIPYECAIDISELISIEDTMEELELGPNGGLLYCMEYLERNMDWLKSRMDSFKDAYFIFDCPGQAELYTHLSCLPKIIEQIQDWNYRITCVHIVDAPHICDASKFISVLLLSLNTMLHLSLPHVNILSKMDLVKQFKLDFDLEYYLEVGDLSHLLEKLEDDPFTKHYSALNSALCDLIQDFSLVSFLPLSIMSKNNMSDVIKTIDKANGYEYVSKDRLNK